MFFIPPRIRRILGLDQGIETIVFKGSVWHAAVITGEYLHYYWLCAIGKYTCEANKHKKCCVEYFLLILRITLETMLHYKRELEVAHFLHTLRNSYISTKFTLSLLFQSFFWYIFYLIDLSCPFLRLLKLPFCSCAPAQLSCSVAHARSVGRSSLDVLSGGRPQK
jgi:hypothetical protein